MKSDRETLMKLVLVEFETKKKARARQAEMIGALEGKVSKATALADKLRRCADGEPCNLAICPICVRGLRESLVLGGTACIEQLGLELEPRLTEFPASR